MVHELMRARETGLERQATQKYITFERLFRLEASDRKSVSQVHNGGVNSLDLDLDEQRYLLSACSRGSVVIHDTENTFGKWPFQCNPVAIINKDSPQAHKYSINVCQWYPKDSGLFVTGACDSKVKVWDANELQVAEEFKFSSVVYHLTMSRAGNTHCLIAVATDDSKISLCDIRSGSSSHVLRGHSGAVLSLAWSPRDDYTLASGSADNKLKVWDVRAAKANLMTFDQHNGKATGAAGAVTSHNGHVNGICYTADGQHILSYGTDGNLRCWNSTSGKNTLTNYGRLRNTSKGHVQLGVTSFPLNDMVFVPDAFDLKLFDVQSGMVAKRLPGHFNRVNCCQFDVHRQELYSGASDANILVWTPKNTYRYGDKSDDENSENGNVESDSDGGCDIASIRAWRNVRRSAMRDAWSSSDED